MRTLDPVLAAGGERDEIPLRVLPYVFETEAAGRTRVLVAIEVGTAALAFRGTGGQRTAALDVTVLAVSRDHPATVPLDSNVDLTLDAEAPGGWWTFSRELHLPPGPARVRALVRDRTSGRRGLVSQRVEVPGPGPYISTLLLSDRLAPRAGTPGARKLVPMAHRTFPQRGQLYCAYEVYVSPGRELNAVPDVVAGYLIEGPDGQAVASSAPTPIAIALGAQLVRVHAIPLDRLSPGRYRVTVRATDRRSGTDMEASDAFVVEAPTEPGSMPD